MYQATLLLLSIAAIENLFFVFLPEKEKQRITLVLFVLYWAMCNIHYVLKSLRLCEKFCHREPQSLLRTAEDFLSAVASLRENSYCFHKRCTLCLLFAPAE